MRCPRFRNCRKGPSEAVHFGPAAEAVSEEFDENDGAVRVIPKLVSKGDLRRILSLRRVIDAIRMGLPEKSLGVSVTNVADRTNCYSQQ